MRTVHEVPYWQVLWKLDVLNHAKQIYEEAESEEERQQADELFANCYDWLTLWDIPIYYDPGPKLWLPRLF